MEVLGQIVYEKIDQIGVGQGMMSEVWRAIDKYMGGEVAIKEIPKRKLRNQNVSDFFQEAKIMFASGQPSPSNVVPIRYACDCPNLDIVALCMPLYRNGSLLDETRRGPISIKRLLSITHEVLNGLQKIHNARFFHFDLKPSNVLFSDSGSAHVADFGQARPIEADGTAGFPAMYPGGIPPEFYTGSTGSFEADTFHMGVLLYRACNGEPFFNLHRPSPANYEREVLAGRFPLTSEFMPHVPRSLRTIIRTAVKVDPTDRYHTALDMERALSSVLPTHDWAIELLPGDEVVWRSRRQHFTGIDVELRQDGTLWSVSLYNNNGSGKRMARQRPDWKGRLTRKQALDRLKKLFEGLE